MVPKNITMGPKDAAINHDGAQEGDGEKYEVKQKIGTSLPNLVLSFCSVFYVACYTLAQT